MINGLEYLIGDDNVLENMVSVPALPMFSEVVMNFLDSLSKELRHDEATRTLVDVQTYAFWIRRSSLEREKGNHEGYEHRMGRGVAFHIAPSNVPVNFAVSMTSALLAGNACIIRVSNKEFLQVDIICDAINRLLANEFDMLKPYFVVVRYNHDEQITQYLTDMCDIRIIWGGNQTINIIRQAALPPRAIELAFADRYSIALINADAYLAMDEKKVARDFYTDTYYSDQNACSSPRMIIWTGREKEKAKEIFWDSLSELARQDYDLKMIQSVDKYDSFCRLSAKCSDISPGLKVNLVKKDNYVYRIVVNELRPELFDYKEAGGYFFEYDAEDVREIVLILGKKCQTVAVIGHDISEIEELVRSHGVRGVDRLVRVGNTMDLSFKWDGYDMIETMSRIVSV